MFLQSLLWSYPSKTIQWIYSHGCCSVPVSSLWAEDCKPPACRRWRLVACKNPGSRGVGGDISPVVNHDLSCEQSYINMHLSKRLPTFKSLSQWKKKLQRIKMEGNWLQVTRHRSLLGSDKVTLNLVMSYKEPARRDHVRWGYQNACRHIYRGNANIIVLFLFQFLVRRPMQILYLKY